MKLSHLAFTSAMSVWIAVPAAWASDLQARWSWQLPARKPAWEFTPRMPADTGYKPVVVGEVAAVGCEHDGSVRGFDLKTGDERWRYFTGGPVRFEGAASEDGGTAFVGSDDGVLYALGGAGKLLWKVRGGPSGRKVIGHDRMISAWPVSAPPVVAGGKVIAVFGHWPVDGIFVKAFDIKTGAALWENSTLAFRPSGVAGLQNGRYHIQGHGGSALLDLESGVVLQKKPESVPPVEYPEFRGADGQVVARTLSGGNFFISTKEGKLFGFGEGEGGEVKRHEEAVERGGGDFDEATQLLAKLEGRSGYALVDGITDGALVEGLVAQSELHVVACDPDSEKVEKLRMEFGRRGRFETRRLALFVGEAEDLELPPYFADLVVSESGREPSEALRDQVHPYGGAWALREGETWKVTRRDRAPEGAADWPQEFFDETNSLASPESGVKAPLGLLWYGGEAADARFYFDGNVDHQSGDGLNPQPVPAQVVEGRIFLQSQARLAAADCYTGRILWEAELPEHYAFGGSGGGLGIHSKNHPEPWKFEKAMAYEVPPTHHCRASGFNYVALPVAVYVCASGTLIRFDPATGVRTAEWEVPLPEQGLCWGGIRIAGDILLATAFRPKDLHDAKAGHDGNGGDWAGDRMPMAYLVALDRRSGEMLWARKAEWGFVNRSGICVGNGRVFVVDLVTEDVFTAWEEAGRKFPGAGPELAALDLKTGAEIWTKPLDILTRSLAYSRKGDFLLAPCRNLIVWKDGRWTNQSKDVRRGKTDKNAPGVMRALRPEGGEVIWEVATAAYHHPLIVMDDVIIDRDGTTYDPGTGERHRRISQLSGEEENWGFSKSGCNHLIACANMVTWRTAFYDLEGGSGVVRLEGFDAGCSPTLLPACGVLSIPNFGTHHKRNRMTAMALVHRPENRHWGRFESGKEKRGPVPLRHVGFDFGAPGDTLRDGVPWLGVAAGITNGVILEPKDGFTFFRTGSEVRESGVSGATKITVPSVVPLGEWPEDKKARSKYVVTLHFSAPVEDAGESVADVFLEGKLVAEGISTTAQEAVEYEVDIEGLLDVEIVPKKGATSLAGLELERR